MKCSRGFSLIEVVIAIGLLGTGVAAILGLMAASSKMIAESTERHGAERTIANGAAELERVGFLAATTRLTDDAAIPFEANQYFESRDGRRAGWGAAVATGDRFYALSAYRLESVSPRASDSTGQGLAVLLRVEWPASSAERSSIQLIHVILR